MYNIVTMFHQNDILFAVYIIKQFNSHSNLMINSIISPTSSNIPLDTCIAYGHVAAEGTTAQPEPQREEGIYEHIDDN